MAAARHPRRVLSRARLRRRLGPAGRRRPRRRAAPGDLAGDLHGDHADHRHGAEGGPAGAGAGRPLRRGPRRAERLRRHRPRRADRGPGRPPRLHQGQSGRGQRAAADRRVGRLLPLRLAGAGQAGGEGPGDRPGRADADGHDAHRAYPGRVAVRRHRGPGRLVPEAVASGRRVRVGLRLPQYATTWPALRAAAERAEGLGFDGLWLNDHLQTPGRLPGDAAFDAFGALAALAPLTARARLGISVLSASYRAPALAAKAATVIDAIAGGRLVVGLGAGSDREEHAAYGMTFGTPGERTAGVRRALAVMRAMAGEPDGASVPGLVAEARNRPASPQPGGPPIW